MSNRLTDRYRVEGTVGKGSAATVYRVWDRSENRSVALKRLSKRDNAGHERRVALFQQEYFTLVDLAHPHIIEVYDYGLLDDDPYYTMELLEGEELVRMAPTHWQRACSLLRDIASSLAIIHSRRLVHRDLSTRNVRCNKSGRAKLIDFGALVSMGAVKDVVGTAAFMAPEVVYAQPLEGRADLFSLGALAYWLLSGRYAYPARTIQQLKNAWRSPPRSLVQIVEEIPPALDSLVLSLLSLDKLARPVNAAEVIERLTAIGQLEQHEVLQVSQAYMTTPSIVGRERELGIFRTRMLSALRGRGSTVMLEGKSGVGRSRLLSSFVLEGKLAGATVLSAQGGGGHGGDYGVISVLFERMLDALPEETTEAALPRAQVLGHMIPGLRASSRQIKLIIEPDPERLRARIQRALYEVFTQVLNRVALMIAVDDVHLCDEPSMAALATLAKISSQRRLVLVLTLNPEIEIHQSMAFKALRSSGTNIELKPLGARDSAWLVQSMFGDVTNVNIVSDWIYKLSRGNVRTLLELAQHLVDNGIAKYRDGNWVLPKDLREQKLPESLRHALEARIFKLSVSARSFAESLSLVTEYAPLKLEHYVMLSETGDQRSVYSALDELVASQVLLRSGDDYSFSQPGYIDILERGLDDERRQRIHLRLAAVYQSGDYGSELVHIHHLQQSGEQNRAIDLLLDIIERVKIYNAPFPLQVQCFETALRSIETDKTRRRASILIRGCLVDLARKYDLSLLKYADELEEHLRRDSGLVFWDEMECIVDPSERIQLCLRKAQEIWEATPEPERGLGPLEAVGGMLIYALTMINVGGITFDTRLIAHLPTLVVPFRSLSTIAELVDQIIDAVIRQVHGQSVTNDRLAIQELLSKPIPELDEEIRREIFDFVHPYLLALDEALRSNPSALERADSLEQDPRFTAHAWEIRLLTYLFTGNFRQASFCLRQKELLAIQNPESDSYLLTALILEAEAYVMSGDLMGLKQVLVPIAEKAELYPGWIPLALAMRGAYHFLRGEFEQSRQDLEKMLQIAPVGQHVAWFAGLPILVETLIEMGNVERAKDIAKQSIETAEATIAFPEAIRQLHRVLALADAKLGNVQQAFDRIETAIDKTNSEKVGGVLLGILHETAARVAICGKDVDRFINHAKAVADIYGPGKNPSLIAKYAQLMMGAERTQLLGQWRVQTTLETDFLSVRSATRMLQLVHTTMSECTMIEQGYEKALELLVQLTESTHGHIFAITQRGLRLMAPIDRKPADATQLDSQLCDFLDNWNANRTGQQLETQTLASRTLTRTAIVKRSTITTREDGAFQPLVLWVENQEQPELVCIAALATPELPLDDLLWPFTSVIARYLLELRI